MHKLFLAAYVIWLVGLAVGSVNDIPEVKIQPYGWDIVWSMAIGICFPAYLGYKIGYEEGVNSNE